MTKVELKYFNDRGRHMADGEYWTARVEFNAIIGELLEMLKRGENPGMAGSVFARNGFYATATTLGTCCLILPEDII